MLPLVLCALIACGDSDKTTEPVKGTTPPNKQVEEAPAAVTGAKVFQRDAEAIAADLRRLEKHGRPTDQTELAKFEREVMLRINHIDLTLRALAVSIKAESRQIVEKSHAILSGQKGELRKKMDTVHREILEIQTILAKKAKGEGELPPGFTEDELKDRIGDLEKEMAKLEDEEKDVNAKMDEKAEMLNSGEIPEQGDTVLTKEREVFQSLRERAVKLQQKS